MPNSKLFYLMGQVILMLQEDKQHVGINGFTSKLGIQRQIENLIFGTKM